MRVFGQLLEAGVERVSSDPSGSDLWKGRIWYNTTDSLLKFYDGSNKQIIPDGLYELDLDTAPSNGQVLEYVSASTKYKPRSIVQADGSINTHSDVDTTTTPPSNNDTLSWDGSKWVPASQFPANLNEISDVNTSGKASGHLLKWSGSAWVSVLDSKQYSVSFSNDTQSDINVGADGFNARKCLIEVMDGSSYETVRFTIQRPDVNTIRLYAGGSHTGSYKALVKRIHE